MKIAILKRYVYISVGAPADLIVNGGEPIKLNRGRYRLDTMQIEFPRTLEVEDVTGLQVEQSALDLGFMANVDGLPVGIVGSVQVGIKEKMRIVRGGVETLGAMYDFFTQTLSILRDESDVTYPSVPLVGVYGTTRVSGIVRMNSTSLMLVPDAGGAGAGTFTKSSGTVVVTGYSWFKWSVSEE